ncbi:PD-(D/E)XK motif protein [Jiangella ureilytica]|nr:PD-(D/E)XK motif protein [Jiangella ureilytica]
MNRPLDISLWQQLASDPAVDGIVRRRVLPETIHDVFLGEKRPSGQRVLLLSIKGPPIGLPRKRPLSRGLAVDVEISAENLVNIQLTSTSPAGDSLFAELASDVVGVLAQSPGHGAAGRVLDRVVAWQSFFAARREVFTGETAAGLFAELTVLGEILIPAIGPSSAVAAWCGPDPAVQDFQRGDLAVEVKSYRGNGPGKLSISSERQLDVTGLSELYLAYIRLDQRPEGTGTTLGQAIDSLKEVIAETASAYDLFLERLLSYGWHESLTDTLTDRYHVRSSELFKVSPGFPRILAESLPLGVGGVSYHIDRSAIEEFLFPEEAFAARLRELH